MPLSSTLLGKIINGSAIPIFVIDAEHKVTHWNSAIEMLTGRKSEDVIGKDDPWKRFYDSKRPLMADLVIDKASEKEFSHYYPGKFQKSPLIDGAYEAEDFFPVLGPHGKWIHFTASPIRDDHGEIIGAIETLVDITERKNLEENLRYYSQQITRAHEEERRYLARELHDDMAQILGSLSRQLDNLLREKHNLDNESVATLQSIQSQLNKGMQSMNRLIRDLRPSLLDDLGLIPALRSLTNNLENKEGIITNFSVEGEEIRLSGEIELSLFRIVQEALNNIRKHARATVVEVKVEFYKGGIRVTVNDDGQGFRPQEKMDNLPRSGKMGLMGMQERVWLHKGTMSINSLKGKGTELVFDIPYAKK